MLLRPRSTAVGHRVVLCIAQLPGGSLGPVRVVRETEDCSLCPDDSFSVGIAFTELKQQQPKLTELRPAGPRVMVTRKAKKDHPWRQGYQNMKPRIPNQVIATPLVGMRTYASP